MEYSCSCSCENCNNGLKIRPFEFKIYRVKGLNKPFTRSGRVFGNILHMIDSTIGIITLGHFGSNIGAEWIIRELHKFFQYDEDRESEYKSGKLKFKVERFKFKIWRIGRISRPFTRSEKIFGYILRMVDAIVGIITFGHFDSYFSHEWTSRELNKLGLYIEKYGVEKL